MDEFDFQVRVDWKPFVERGWEPVDPTKPFPAFLTGISCDQAGATTQCDRETLQRWEADHRRFPPYQYLRHHCLLHPNGALRVPSVCEREVMLGFPVQYTLECLPKSEAKRSPASLLQTRYQLLGRASSVFALSYLVMHLMAPLGFSRYSDLQSLQQALTPGGGASLHSFLFRPPLACKPNVQRDSLAMSDLAQRLMGSVHCKGEDLLIHSSTEVGITQRLRQSISAKTVALENSGLLKMGSFRGAYQ